MKKMRAKYDYNDDFILEFPDDVDNMVRILLKYGYDVHRMHVNTAWILYSDSMDTGWIHPGEFEKYTEENEKWLVNTLLQYLIEE